jgi:hypothetical protein
MALTARQLIQSVRQWHVMNLKRVKILGAYLLASCAMQICIYLALSIPSQNNDWLFYLDPRIGIFFIESSLRGTEQLAPGIFRWLSAIWILLLGSLLFSGRALIKTYIVSEIVLSLPNLLFIFLIVWANLSPAHGFSVGELFFPVMVMIAFSLVPLVLAFRALHAIVE